MNSSPCAMRLAALDLLQRRVRPAEADVLGDRAVEEEVVLQHDAELRRGSRAAGASARSRPSTRIRPLSGRLNAMTRLMSVLLPEPLDPTSAVVVPAGRAEADVLQHRHAGVVLEADVLELDLAVDLAERRARASSSSSVGIVHQLADAIETGEGFADLRADRRDLHDRRGHQAGEEDVVDEVAERHLARPGSRGRRRRS